MSNRIHLPKNLFILRKLNNLRQDEMESRTGCSRTTWSNYENGVSEPSVSTLVKISHFFGTTLDDIVLKDLSLEGDLRFTKKRPKGVIYGENGQQKTESMESQLSYWIGEVKKMRKELDDLKEQR